MSRLQTGSCATIVFAALTIGGAANAHAQPKVFYACYVPLSGTMYRVNEPDVKPTCASTAHVLFNWTDGANALHVGDAILPTLPSGAFDFSNANGFTSSGSFGSGLIPISGAGTRLMWYPGKYAFRAGQVSLAQWDDANVGDGSVAFGQNNTASGVFSFVAGHGSSASGASAAAIGALSTASGSGSIALGTGNTASASGAFAAGTFNVASGAGSTALGTNTSTNGMQGAFVYADQSAAAAFGSGAANEFAVRAAGGFRFRTAGDLSTGCDLPAGSGAFSCTSSRFAKPNFRAMRGDDVLRKIAGLPIESWQYRTDSSGARHIGPTAQDFRAAFGLGTDDTSISLVDIDGINLLGVQTLARRMATLDRQNADLRARIVRSERENAALYARIEKIERALEHSGSKVIP